MEHGLKLISYIFHHIYTTITSMNTLEIDKNCDMQYKMLNRC